MKKTYQNPQIEVMDAELQGMLCMSILDGTITEPLAPELDPTKEFDDLDSYFDM